MTVTAWSEMKKRGGEDEAKPSNVPLSTSSIIAYIAILHLATSNMRFGGVGESGMGSYHGKAGFETFSHMKSIVDRATWIDPPMRYQPYTKLNDLIVRLCMG